MIELTGNEIDRLAEKHGGNGEPIVKAFKQRSPRCHFKQMDLVYGEHPSGSGVPERWWECSTCGHTKDVKS